MNIKKILKATLIGFGIFSTISSIFVTDPTGSSVLFTLGLLISLLAHLVSPQDMVTAGMWQQTKQTNVGQPINSGAIPQNLARNQALPNTLPQPGPLEQPKARVYTEAEVQQIRNLETQKQKLQKIVVGEKRQPSEQTLGNGNNNVELSCPYCGEPQKTEHYMNMHIVSKHKDELPWRK